MLREDFERSLRNSYENGDVVPGYDHLSNYILKDFLHNGSDEVFDWIYDICTGEDGTFSSNMLATLKSVHSDLADHEWRINLIQKVCGNLKLNVRDAGYSLAEEWGTISKRDREEIIKVLEDLPRDKVDWLENYRVNFNSGFGGRYKYDQKFRKNSVIYWVLYSIYKNPPPYDDAYEKIGHLLYIYILRIMKILL